MSMTNFKLFGTEIIVNSTPDSSTDEKVLDPAKEEPIHISAALTPTTANNIKPIFPNPNPNPSSSSGVSTELGLGCEVNNNNNGEAAGDEWGKMIKKRLTRSDLNGLSRLMVSRKAMEERVLSLMGKEMRMSVQSGSGMRVEMVDDDTGHVHNMVLKLWHSSNCYIINGGWIKYTKTRELLPKDEIGLRWDPRHCCFHITVLGRAG